jgi:AmmeMemoRadiSam system protein B
MKYQHPAAARRLFIVLSVPLTLAAGAKVRTTFDDVGFCTRTEQIEKVIEVSEALEKPQLEKTREALKGTTILAGIFPHDDHLYAGRVYVHVVPFLPKARTVVIFGVTHKEARTLLGDPRDVVILDDFDAWEGPYGPVKVDKTLRARLKKKLGEKAAPTSGEGHAHEHSIEAVLPFLQHANPGVKIVPVMVTQMSFERMKELAGAVAAALSGHAKEKKLSLGKDIAILISTDTTHYGPDFAYSPFGVDAAAHEKGTAQDRLIGETLLSGTVGEDGVESFTKKVWGEGITWCGKFSVPFGLLAARSVTRTLLKKDLVGIPVRYADSYSLGVLPIPPIGIGTTAPFSLKHWVGYWGILYGVKD